jgi:hypothetical protein
MLHVHDGSSSFSLLAPIRFAALLLPLCASVLIPSLDVPFAKPKRNSKFAPIDFTQIFLCGKLVLQSLELMATESGSLLLSLLEIAREFRTTQWRLVASTTAP